MNLEKKDQSDPIGKDAELKCCQALFCLQRDCTCTPEHVSLVIPSVRVNDMTRIPEVSDHFSAKTKDIAMVMAKDVAIKAVEKYTNQKIIGEMEASPTDEPARPYVTPLIPMARIMYVLRELFGAEEAEMQTKFFDRLDKSGETDARKNNEAEFEQLLNASPSIGQIKNDINREAGN